MVEPRGWTHAASEQAGTQVSAWDLGVVQQVPDREERIDWQRRVCHTVPGGVAFPCSLNRT